MARLIDADALKERAIRVSTVKEHTYFKAVGTREIDKAPTVDAVEVVRCKDCYFWHRHTEVNREYGDCFNYGTTKKEDGFCDKATPFNQDICDRCFSGSYRSCDGCSYGERKNNAR
jgi:hypothetical protein